MLFDVLQAIGLGTAVGVLAALMPTRAGAGALAIFLGLLLGVAVTASADLASWLVAVFAAASSLASGAAFGLFAGVRSRLGGAGIGGLVLYAVAAAAVIAAVSLLFAPLGALALIALGWLGFAARRRADEKYAGLRILR